MQTAPRPRVGIIGSGISGMAAAYLLNRVADVTVLEKDGRPGGHANTVDVEEAGRKLPVDTGFIVYNRHTYPLFCKLLEELKVESRDSDMSFSVKAKVSGLEYCGTNLATIFAQRKNLLKPWFYRMLWDIIRFNKAGHRILKEGTHGEWSLGRYLDEEGYGRRFREYYVLPMGAAIWSTPPARMLEFPLHSFLLFLANHGMLGVDTHFQWRTIAGGSREYVKKLIAPFKDRILYNAGARAVRRENGKVKVELEDGRNLEFDKVVMATHADITLKLLADARAEEKELLSLYAYQPNEAVLHSRREVLPERTGAWAAWNYEIDERALGGAPCLHYHMNRLQGLPSEREYIVTLNPTGELPLPDAHYRTVYEHPLYSVEGMGRQKEIQDLNGRDGNQVFFCGAYCGFGFHEDGLRSAVAVAKRFGVEF
jgi:predicted NAD/FAD-binding protein